MKRYMVNGTMLLGSRTYWRVDVDPDHGGTYGMAMLLNPFALCLDKRNAEAIVDLLNAAGAKL